MQAIDLLTHAKKTEEDSNSWFDHVFHPVDDVKSAWPRMSDPYGDIVEIPTESTSIREFEHVIIGHSSRKTHRGRRIHVPIDPTSIDEPRSRRLEVQPKPSITRLTDHPKYEEILADAAEEGYPIPSPVAISNALMLFDLIPRDLPREPDIYARSDGKVTVDVRNGEGDYVTLLCDGEGHVLSMFNVDNFEEYSDCASVQFDVIVFLFESLKSWDA